MVDSSQSVTPYDQTSVHGVNKPSLIDSGDIHLTGNITDKQRNEKDSVACKSYLSCITVGMTIPLLFLSVLAQPNTFESVIRRTQSRLCLESPDYSVSDWSLAFNH